MIKGAKHAPQWCLLYYEDMWVSKGHAMSLFWIDELTRLATILPSSWQV